MYDNKNKAFYLIFTANPPDQEAHVFNSVINSFLHTIVLTVNEVFVEYNRFDYVSSYVIIGGVIIENLERCRYIFKM